MVRTRREDRCQPDHIHTERFQVTELLLYSFEIPAEEVAVEDTGAMRVLIGSFHVR